MYRLTLTDALLAQYWLYLDNVCPFGLAPSSGNLNSSSRN